MGGYSVRKYLPVLESHLLEGRRLGEGVLL